MDLKPNFQIFLGFIMANPETKINPKKSKVYIHFNPQALDLSKLSILLTGSQEHRLESYIGALKLNGHPLFAYWSREGKFQVCREDTNEVYGELLDKTSFQSIDYLFGKINGLYSEHSSSNPTFELYDSKAILPTKSTPDSIGYDLWIIKISKHIPHYSTFKGEQIKVASTLIGETGVKAKPPYGYYFEINVRSSLVKYGVSLANDCGIIDPDYRGTIKVALNILGDQNEFNDLTLPAKVAQLKLLPYTDKLPLVETITDKTERDEEGGINHD